MAQRAVNTVEFDVRISNMKARFDSECKVHLNLDFAGFFTFQTSTLKGIEVVSVSCGGIAGDFR